jgi:hypothetical protein
LGPQIIAYREYLDRLEKKVNLQKHISLVVMIYATKFATAPDSPTPSYVKQCLDIALLATSKGFANGVVTYGLPKNKADFIEAASNSYSKFMMR